MAFELFKWGYKHKREHGTRVRYQQGCKCESCRAANATYVARRKRARPSFP